MSDETDHTTKAEAVTENRLSARLDRIEAKLDKLTEPVVEEERRNSHPMQRRVSNAEKHWVTRVLLLGVTIAAVWSLYEFYEERKARAEEREARIEERIARAWQTLSAPTAGNSGKGKAISFLLEQKQDLGYMNLGASPFRRVTIEGLSTELLTIYNADIRFSDWYGLEIEDISFSSSRLDAALLEGSFGGAISGSQAIGTKILRTKLPQTGADTLYVDHSILDYAEIDAIDKSKDPVVPDPSTVVVDGQPLQVTPRPTLDFEITSTSLRCAVLQQLLPGQFSIRESNLSGALLDVTAFDETPVAVKPDPENSANEGPFGGSTPRTKGRKPDEIEEIVVIEDVPFSQITITDPAPLKEALAGSFYFSDNPPRGIPADILPSVLESFDRAEITPLCEKEITESHRDGNRLFGSSNVGPICQSILDQKQPCNISQNETSRNAAYWFLD